MKGDNLPSLQKMIVLHLSENMPQTMNETAEILSKCYKPTWTAFKSLEKKKLIKKTAFKEHAGRKYPTYWLTDTGIIRALLEGANYKKLSNQAKSLHPNDRNLHLFLDIEPHVDHQILKMIYSSVKGKKKLDVLDVINLLFIQAPNAMEIENAEKIAATLQKYPDEYNLLKTAKNLIIEQLNRIIP